MDDEQTSRQPGGGADPERDGQPRGPGGTAPGGGATVGSGAPPPGEEAHPLDDDLARAGTGDVPAQDAASAGTDEPSTTGIPGGAGDEGTDGPRG